jgi:predicted esterase
MTRLLPMLLASLLATLLLVAPGPSAATFREFDVELPTELRKFAGGGKLSPVTHALVTIAVPANFDASHDWPVLVISATSVLEYRSSRRLLRAYADMALAGGWVAVAADPAEDIPVEQDNVAMRIALNTAALGVVGRQWPSAAKAPLAFGGFSIGAKVSGWLAAAFASQGRRVIGVYQAGIGQDTLVEASVLFDVVNAAFKRVPVFILAGERDQVVPRVNQEDVVATLKRAGFRNVRIEYFPGAHEVNPAPLRAALDWFRELAALPAAAR